MSFKTLQEAFDTTIEKLRNQGRRCMNQDGSNCVYGNGCLHCAIGFYLPAKLMDEDCGFSDLMNQFPELEELFDITDTDWDISVQFWGKIQEAHDESLTPGELNYRLEEMAEDFSLKSHEPFTEWE